MRALTRMLTIFLPLFLGSGLLALSSPAIAQDLLPWSTQPPKPAPDGEAAPRVPVTQGDTVEDPFALPGIPFMATGNTCAFNDDYDHECPYDGSLAQDVVYRYECAADVVVDINLCESTYDTKVYVFEDVANNVIVCNDDYCSFQSIATNVPFAAGHTYFIVIDGYGDSCGDYALAVREHEPCVLECPPGAVPEGEPDCHENYHDIYNSGCGGHPDYYFTHVEPSCDPIVICGTTGVFAMDTLTYRDSDWYEITLTESSNICLAGDAEVPCYFFVIDGRNGCDSAYEVVAYTVVGECAPVEDFCYYCDPGTWWLWVGPNAWDLGFACGSKYWMEVTGYTNGVTPAEGATWGRVKGLFR